MLEAELSLCEARGLISPFPIIQILLQTVNRKVEWNLVEVEWCLRNANHVLGAPVGMRRGQHELKLHDARVVFELPVLDAVELICDVCSPNIHLRKDEKVILCQPKNITSHVTREVLNIPPERPFGPPGCCGRRSWAARRRWTSRTE